MKKGQLYTQTSHETFSLNRLSQRETWYRRYTKSNLRPQVFKHKCDYIRKWTIGTSFTNLKHNGDERILIMITVKTMVI